MHKYISMIPYANLAPLRQFGPPSGYSFVYLDPRRSVQALIDNHVIAAAVPVGALTTLGDRVRCVGMYGVASCDAVESVMLFSKHSWKDLGKEHKIYLSTHSETSIRLLHILLRRRKRDNVGIPKPVLDINDADAVLLIGDDALAFADSGSFKFAYDLAGLWYKAMGKPMVFARWVVNKNTGKGVKDALESWLDQIKRRQKSLVSASADIESSRLGIQKKDMLSYLKGIRFALCSDDLAGQDLFMTEVNRCEDEFRRWVACVRGDAQKVRRFSRARINRSKAVKLLSEAPINELMQMGFAERKKKHPGDLVSFVMDTNPNYTNVCTTRCRFCAFWESGGSVESYTMTPSQLADKVEASWKRGAGTVLLQGGHNPEINLRKCIAYIRRINERCPGIQVHPFSPPEIDYLARREGKTPEYVLNVIWNEGVHTLPGGGAEILVDRVRSRLSPDKCTAQRWLDIMEIAHGIGFKTTATMMYGHLEKPRDIIEHLFRLRDLQDRTGGFSSFVPWSFKPGNSELSKFVKEAAHPSLYVRIIAVARIVLDNFSHIQSSWFSETDNAGILGLIAGADDFGGVLVEENVLKTAGYSRSATADDIKKLIRNAGFTPALRNSDYRITKIFR